RPQRRIVELRAHDIAQRVALERAAHEAVVPVHVLQDAVGVRFGNDSEVGAETLAPRLGKVFDLELALEKLELEIESHDDVQAVRHLVSVGADERAFDLVDRSVERVEGYAAELGEKQLLQIAVERVPEGTAASHDVLPQARLALVNSRRAALSHRGCVPRG